ncbi:MAG: hypothetical protein LAQ30_03170 [Acidobacteriia bacterium]|nr:hypothetical protein [Terriglobia bacterium]
MHKGAAILAMLLASAGGLDGQTIPAHTRHYPNISNMVVTYGITGEPSNLAPGIRQWFGGRFDRVLGPGVGPKDGKTWWLDYTDMAGVYAAGIYGAQTVAKTNGFAYEDMLLHTSVDMQYRTPPWKDMQQFDAFESSSNLGNYLTAIHGVFTYAAGSYTDVTVKSYSGSSGVTVANALYVGYMEPFDQMNFAIQTPRYGGTTAYEYWNGSGWAALVTQSDSTNGLGATGRVYFYPPGDWTPTVVNGSKSKFWIRVTVSGATTYPAYSKLYGDDWAVSSGQNNARGWNGAVPPCPTPAPPGTACRMNVGTRMEYDPYPPANASAKFKYQSRATGVWSVNYTFGNPSNIQNGVRTWARFLSETAAATLSATGEEGIMFDNAGATLDGAVLAPANPMQYTDYNHAKTFDNEVIAMYREVRDSLRAVFGPNVQVGTNTTDAFIARAGDWTLAESWRYSSYGLGLGLYTYSDAAGASTYDAFLPANNPGGTKAWLVCYDTPSALTPGVIGNASWHYWDRSNRSPIGCLAQHYIGSNANTGFSYYSQGGFIYGDTDEVYTYAVPTTLKTAAPADTTSSSKNIELASAAGCGAMSGGFYSGQALLRLGTPASGDTVVGKLTGTTFTTTWPVYNAYPAGSPAYCIQQQHQSLVSPPAENVWSWGNWFPAMQVDLGAPDGKGVNGGARMTPWKTGGAPNYIAGQPRSACDADKEACSGVWRRDFARAIVLMRPFLRALESEIDTLSNPIELGWMYYPLRADGTTGAGVRSVRLRANEAAILMRAPLQADTPPLPPPPPTLPPRPLCDAGQQRTFQAGYGAQLDGTASAAKDGGAGLTFQWGQLSGPTSVSWSSRSDARPMIQGLVSGSYVFQLTVTDSSSQSSVCTVKHGVVATNNNGAVITNNPAVDALLGPLVPLGANPWPWFDTLHKADADLQMSLMDTSYPAWWDTAGPGTVTVAAGSQTITGQGTTFTTTFCQGPVNPSTPKPGAVIAVWYNTGTPGQTGRRMLGVTGCADDTHVSTDDAWDSSALAAGAGLNYAADDSTTHHAADWGWGQADSPGNAYDNVAAYYALYYRSGMDDYLAAARKLADRFWRSPMIDRGTSQIAGHSGRYGLAARSLSGPGLIVRALELQGTAEDMWPGLRTIADTFMGYLNGVDKAAAPGMWDTREEAAHLTMISYCALFDPDGAHRANCKAALSNSFATIWGPSKQPDGSWGRLFYSRSSWDTHSSVWLTSGSTTVTGNGTAWRAEDFPATLWFTNDPANKPPSNSAGDGRAYTATFVSATSLSLEQPYRGITGIHGWAMAIGASMVGWGAAPADMGVLAAAFDLSARALGDTFPREASLAKEYAQAAAGWIATYGYWPSAKGLYAAAQGINCQAPIADSNASCTGGATAEEARALNARAIRGVMGAYAWSQDNTFRDFADTLYDAMFAKPGTCPYGSSLCLPDGVYVTGMDPNGRMMTGTPPEGNKWLGMFFGSNQLSSWPAQRGNALQPASTRDSR